MKRVLSILLTLALLCGVFALASCGGSSSSSTTTADTTDSGIDAGTGTESTTTMATLPDPIQNPDLAKQNGVLRPDG